MKKLITWCISPVTGQDGRPSWAKLITAAVLGLYAIKAPVPGSVAIVAIAAAHGTKVLLAALQRSTITTVATTALNYSRSDVDETRRKVLEHRDVREGFDPSVPRPARTPEEQP